MFYAFAGLQLSSSGSNATPLAVISGVASDLMIIVQMLLLGRVMVALRPHLALPNPIKNALTAAGLIAVAAIVIAQLLLVTRVWTIKTNSAVTSPAIGLLGVWMIAASVSGRRTGATGRGLKRLGLIAGGAAVILGASYLAFGGYSTPSDPRALRNNISTRDRIWDRLTWFRVWGSGLDAMARPALAATAVGIAYGL